MPLQDAYDALLLDLDGTVWEGGRAIARAVDAINAAPSAKVYITNNASRSPAVVATMLREVGLKAFPHDVLTSAQAAIALAGEFINPGEPVLVVGAPSFRELAKAAGYRVVASADDRPALVLHGHSPDTGWADLSEAALAIARGAAYVASNVDTTLPTQRGLMVGNGSMVAAVTSATGVVPRSAGKPEPAMFFQAAQQVHSSRPLGVGDRLDTDIAGAVAAGMDSLHVLTGVSGPFALLSAPRECRPTFVAEDLSALAAPAGTLRPGPAGGFSARVEDGEIVLDGGDAERGGSLDALLTALDVAWSQDCLSGRIRPVSSAARAACKQWW
ncbi:putative hydrolase YutF [Corynebacterium capitovis DSM 44611]|uniref:HAD-IIA family hydrolase n=1 Tax=Corynebacterium capitovis TaxID=131081 RepID=UPI000368377F|nr:HAD-IIA family hydrolase [Corynebacterium capitovis]WKD57723.1 putative hydrolase YutF [Corynebacterium capitovis DSM 44611]